MAALTDSEARARAPDRPNEEKTNDFVHLERQWRRRLEFSEQLDPAGGPPTATDSATINGSATTTVDVETADVANSLILSDANATLIDDGGIASLTISGTLTMSNGTLYISAPVPGRGSLTVGALNLSGGALTVYQGGQLNLNGTLSQTGGTLTLDGGTISGGTINSTAGTQVFDDAGSTIGQSGTLSGVTFDGPLNLTANYASVQLANGTTVVSSSGSGPGTINVTGTGSSLIFDNAQTVSNETINLGNSSYYDSLYEYDTTGAGQVLTLASSVTINVAGLAIFYTGGSSGDGIVNKGLIDATTSAGLLQIESSAFTNSGTIDVSGGAMAAIELDDFHDHGVEPHRDRGEFVPQHRSDQRLEQPRLDHAGERGEPFTPGIGVDDRPRLDLELGRNGRVVGRDFEQCRPDAERVVARADAGWRYDHRRRGRRSRVHKLRRDTERGDVGRAVELGEFRSSGRETVRRRQSDRNEHFVKRDDQRFRRARQ